MNQEKAREFFSAYHEGTLEGGLKQTFERRLRSDSGLMAEYRDFVATLAVLDTLRDEEIEVPIFLSDRIATRLEAAQAQQKPKAPAWTVWLRGLAFAGVAGVALFAALIGVFNRGDQSQAGLLNASQANHLTFAAEGGQVELRFQPAEPETVVVSSQGKELARMAVDPGRSLASPLQNPNPGATVFDIEVLGENRQTHIAIPGTARSTQKTGQGTMAEFAKALAGYYRTPVEFQVKDADVRVGWSFESTDVYEAAEASLQGLASHSAVKLPNGMIQILDR